jgi:LacI family transcriptional regulator
MRPIEEFCCQNRDCPDAGKRGAGNLRQHGWTSKKNRIRTLYCRTCKSYFSERKGTVLWYCHLPEDKAVEVLAHVQEGCGVRQTARLVKVNRNTVCRLAAVAGEHARRLHEEKVAVSPSDG